MPKPMTAAQFDKALAKLGFTKTSFAETINADIGTIFRWTSGRLPVPTHIAMLINLMIDTGSTPDKLRP